jgi:hypothetical protein
MSNQTAVTSTTNIVPVQGIFQPAPTFDLISLIGPAGTPFYASINPSQSGLNITNSTINSTTIGAITPSTGAFTSGTVAAAPTGATDLVNKQYVDYYAAGLSWKAPVTVASTANITSLSGLQTIDTIALVAGDTILVKNQSTAANNGIYVVASGAWTRSVGADVWDEFLGAITFVIEGSQAGSAWYCTAQPGGTLGTTAINWSNFSVSSTYTAGTGLTLAGTQFSITPVGAAGTYGSASSVPVFITNASGQVTSVTNTAIAIANTAVSGLGTMSTQNANTVAITGGTLDAVTIGGSTAGAITGTTITANTQFSGAGTGLTGTASSLSIGGNAATATSATTATNLVGGGAGSLPYQSATSTTAMLAAGSNGQVLTLASGVPSWATPTTGTVTSVSGTGTVSGISLSGTVTNSGNLTLGGTLDLSSPPAIGGTTPNTGRFTTGLVGTNANFTDFPNAQLIGSQANTGSAHIYNIGVAGEGVATDVVGAGQWGVGVYGSGATAGATRGIGIVGDGHVSNTADTAAAIGVRGYATQTHSGGQNIGLYAQATGGASNYALFMASGNIYSAVTQTWALPDNEASALSIDATGKAGILKIITTDGAEGISTSGKLDVTGAIGVGSSPSYGTSGQVLTSAGTGAAPTWSTLAYATVTDDTTTNATRYPLFAAVTTGNLTAEFVSSTKFQFNPSTGVLTSTSFTGAGTGLTGTASSLTAGTASALTTGNNYQVNSLGIGTAASGTAGEIRATNNITAYYSDDRLKTKLGKIENALAMVCELEGFYYEANETAQAFGYKVQKEVGVSAQSTQKNMPEIVAPAPIDDKYLTVRYERFAPYLIEAIKELKAKVDLLESK